MPHRMRRVHIEPRVVQNTFGLRLDNIQFPSERTCDRMLAWYCKKMDMWLSEAER
eukprot:CAMPEP_0178771916 /NCGR_PEP_ID=MMETSP0744-20121128/22239_1 /TAXON_ID=913974 /ORGANISM="Nitzschia punctata, Strain CCMP561" /LENGTH=54 /DNA_ID=CAMNT_0020428509 /DNA_START=72 /DNA_END=236 /DNA_ORIENTATION=+